MSHSVNIFYILTLYQPNIGVSHQKCMSMLCAYLKINIVLYAVLIFSNVDINIALKDPLLDGLYFIVTMHGHFLEELQFVQHFFPS